MRQREHELQSECVKIFELKYPKLKHLLFAIPNGGKRNKAVAAKLKREGVRSGVPDLFLACPSSNMAGLFIEMKVGKNKPTKNQKFYLNDLRNRGYATAVCRSVDYFLTLVELYIYPNEKKK